MAGNEMEVQMAGPFPKSNCINPVTPADPLHQLSGSHDHMAPFSSLFRDKVDGSPKMATRIQQAPTHQGCRIGVMPQQPSVITPNLITAKTAYISME